MLGLTGYYHMFFSNIFRPHQIFDTIDSQKVPFIWTDQCQKAFTLSKALLKGPILVYPHQNKPYTLFNDASKYSWSAGLTQHYSTSIEGKTICHQHPISYVSGLFQGSQLNWAALIKEAYAIYMSVKRLPLNHHLPLKRLL